jgi:hypothetical protein
MSHPIFEGVDWEKLKKREIDSPYIPILEDEMDIKHFDP